MVLIKSVSGIRGTIFRDKEENLTPFNILKFTYIYGKYIKTKNLKSKVILGRDGRVSGIHISKMITSCLSIMGIDIINLGMTSTPTVGLSVSHKRADGGIMISASHNSIEWNALKFFNKKGEFLTKEESESIINYDFKNEKEYFLKKQSFPGKIIFHDKSFDFHLSSILKLKEVLVEKIKLRKFKVVVDGINSSGGILVPLLLEKLNISVIKLNCNPTGIFAHNPEPLAKNLKKLSSLVVSKKADFGIAVDPDVDRLVFICEDGSFFGEEYTIIALGSYILAKQKGSTVSNLSSSSGLRDITLKSGSKHFYSAVGESNVINVMKQNNAIFGGEGSGGVVFPKLHYGRDALVGIALFLSYLAETKKSCKKIKDSLPNYFMHKEKILLPEKFNFENLKNKIITSLKKEKEVEFILIDGLRINYNCGSWIHIRKSNTEPVIRVIIESSNKKKLKELREVINFYIKRMF